MASNRNALKSYAPRARLDFIQAITNRAAQFGITQDGNVAGEIQGDIFILNGKAFPRSVANQRGALIERITRDGFAQVMEAVAYTWFNRFLAIRYMEVHHYFDHGFRVISHPNGQSEPEILEKATSLNLAGVDQDEIINLKLEGTQDEQIYRKLLIAQCNDLHRAMPFLFERIDDETELLLPENLLQSDSIIRKLVGEIDEVEWQDIEIIGWLYQFYISEKKDQVIGKVVKSEDIPAATQLFTPNWIVKYMVQNSLGAQWLATYPDSGIRSSYPMEYYIAPAEQDPEVQAQIDAITPKELDPEAITLIDPAVGSGHILVEAYDLFRAIYLERGYTKRDAARSILTKNLFGLDIDDRAAQMAGFALLMKARADDRTVLRNPPKLNVLALQDSEGLNADALIKALIPHERFEMVPSGDLLPETLAQPTLVANQPASAEAGAIRALVKLLDGAKTFGSLITIPDAVMQSLPLLDALLAKPLSEDILKRKAQEDAQGALKPLVEQARLLGGRYHSVVANPPYMGGKGMNADLKAFAAKRYPDSKADLFAIFVERNLHFAAEHGAVAMITMQSWMFLSSYERLRLRLLDHSTFVSMTHLGARGFDSIGGEVVSTTAFVLKSAHMADFKGSYFRLIEGNSEAAKQSDFKQAIANPECGWFFHAAASDFEKIPGSPIAYWVGNTIYRAYQNGMPLSEAFKPAVGLQTGENAKFLRLWHEVQFKKICFDALDHSKSFEFKWFPYNKGGDFRRWYGNQDFVVNWENDGKEIKNFVDSEGQLRSRPQNTDLFFRECISWSKISSGLPAFRKFPGGFIFDVAGTSIFNDSDCDSNGLLGFCNSKPAVAVLAATSPTLNFEVGQIAAIPILPSVLQGSDTVEVLVSISKNDWDSYETSWNFVANPLISCADSKSSLEYTYSQITGFWHDQIEKMRFLEYENNVQHINNYDLMNKLHPDSLISEVTLKCNPYYRYSGDLTDAEFNAKLKSDTMRELVSYAVGCMMGRYSLAEPGLICASTGGVGFDPARYGEFPADRDGIIPLTEEQWFADDAAVRIEEFLGVAWSEAPVMETLTALMDGLSLGKAGEPRAALRSYLSKQFYKDHLQTYKNRPIYWLFSSGKHKAFEALVYLHRYNEGTLARMRTVYVTPLMGKLQQRFTDLEAEIGASSSSAEKSSKTREKDKLAKQIVEIRAFDEELRHIADARIPLDLDEGVKVNYGRFGNLLAAKDKVCGKVKGGDE